jgi:predicted Zn finger-like uncharacterized protein
MIISCTSCNKKFEINSDLIPEKGRLLQCGYCNHKWFFKKNKVGNLEEPTIINNKPILKANIDNDIKEKEEIYINEESNNDNDVLDYNNKDQDIIETKNIATRAKIKILNIILVFIISIIGLIIVLDTFKSPISLIIPNIEIILYNLYETLKDIVLFLKDLIK